MVAAIRPSDMALRLGGEELAVLALVADEQELALMAERLRLAFVVSRLSLRPGRWMSPSAWASLWLSRASLAMMAIRWSSVPTQACIRPSEKGATG